eukprot:8384_1
MSVDPRRPRKQSWWKKSHTRRTAPKRTRSKNPSSDSGTSSDLVRAPQDAQGNNNTQPIFPFGNENSGDILSADPERLTPRQIRTLQTQLSRVIKLNQQLEMELNLRASQVEQMEDNLRLVADQSKMIGVRAMEQEQKLLEVKRALELKTKQLSLFRGSKADQVPLNAITVLPMHLRGKFSEFIRGVLLSQKRFFETALRDFVAQQITDQELSYNKDLPLSRESLVKEVGKIGDSLAADYMSELELRLNGTFSPNQDTKYTLHNGSPNQMPISRTPQMTPNPPQMMQNRPITPVQYHGSQHTQGPPAMLNMHAPNHTPMGSMGSVGSATGMTPQTSASYDVDISKARTKRSASTLDKAKQLFSKKKPKRKPQVPQPIQPQLQPQQQGAPQQYPSPYGQAQPQQKQFVHQHHQYPQMNAHSNGHHQYPPAPSMGSIPSTDGQHNAVGRAQDAYAFPKSTTSAHNSRGNVAMEALMDEIQAAQSESVSRSGSVVIKDDDLDQMHTDEDYSSDQEEKEIPNNVRDTDNRNRANSAGSEESDDDGQEDIDKFEGDTDALAMQQQLLQMTKQHTQAILTKHGADGSNELNKMWSQFVQFKKGMDRPSDAPLAFTVPDKSSGFVELRDMLEALPFDLSCAILREQQMNPTERIKDVTIQRGCWPMVRFAQNNRVSIINKVFLRFDDVLRRLEMYLNMENQSTIQPHLSQAHLDMMSSPKNAHTKGNPPKKLKPPGLQLLGSLDPQKTTGFRLHQITAIVRQRNEARDSVTALNLRVGRLWNMELSMEQNLITDSIDFFQSLDNPSTMLLLGPNTAEKCALCREISRQLSSSPINMRTALVDTRSTVGGFVKSPIETGQAVRFYVNSVTNQKNQIDATRSIYPQVVVVDEVLSLNDIESIGKLQSEGISVIVGTNMHSLEALLGHPLYSQLLPPQDRLLEHGVALNTMSGSSSYSHQRKASYLYSAMSPHLLILEMNSDGTEVKMYKNIPAAVKAIKRFSQPEYTSYQLKWQGYNPSDSSHASKYMNNELHKRTTSRMVNRLMKDTLSYRNVGVGSALSLPGNHSQGRMNIAESTQL